jgi:hypothetical protein
MKKVGKYASVPVFVYVRAFLTRRPSGHGVTQRASVVLRVKKFIDEF